MTEPHRRDLGGGGFNEVPELYDRARPAYPDELFADLLTSTGMDRRSSVLEVGCGTGQVTRSLAALVLGDRHRAGAPDPRQHSCRGGWRGDRPPVGSPGLPGAFHRGALAPAAGPAHEGTWRGGLRRAGRRYRAGRCARGQAAVLSSATQAKGLDAVFRSVAGPALGCWPCSPAACRATAFTA